MEKTNKVEQFAIDMLSFVKANADKMVKTDGKNEWKFSKDGVEYCCERTEDLAKTGRKCNKHTMYKIVNGAEKVVQFGAFKKKYLYAITEFLMGKSDSNKIASKDLLAKICADAKKNVSHYSLDADMNVSGECPDVGKITCSSVQKQKVDGSMMQYRKMFIDGKEVMSGVKISKLVNAVKTAMKKSSKKASKTK